MESMPLDENRRAIPWHWIILGLLVVVHAGVGAWLNPLPKTISSNRIIGVMAIGIILSQPLLFAFWAAFAPQHFFHRFLWSLLLCNLVSFVEDIGSFWYRKESIGVGMVLDITLFVDTIRNRNYRLHTGMMSDLILFLAATMILLLARRMSCWRIRRSFTEDVHPDCLPHQFGIIHLISLMTITAFTCGLFRTLAVVNPNQQWLSSMTEVITFVFISLSLLLPVVAIPWCVLASHGTLIALTSITIVVWGACDLAAFIVGIPTIPKPPVKLDDEQIIRLLVQLGAALSVLLTTLVMRWCGFRMIRMPRTATGEP